MKSRDIWTVKGIVFLSTKKSSIECRLHLVQNNRLVAGGIIIREGQNGTLEVFLISSSSTGNWVIPKGGWETDETAEEAALRESLEEGGVVGEIVKPLSVREVEGNSGSRHYHIFLMNVVEIRDEWAESALRKRKFAPLNEALTFVDKRYLPFLQEAHQIFSDTHSN